MFIISRIINRLLPLVNQNHFLWSPSMVLMILHHHSSTVQWTAGIHSNTLWDNLFWYVQEKPVYGWPVLLFIWNCICHSVALLQSLSVLRTSCKWFFVCPSMNCVQPCFIAYLLLLDFIICVFVLSLNFDKRINKKIAAARHVTCMAAL